MQNKIKMLIVSVDKFFIVYRMLTNGFVYVKYCDFSIGIEKIKIVAQLVRSEFELWEKYGEETFYKIRNRSENIFEY